eukprot:gene3761-4682_t
MEFHPGKEMRRLQKKMNIFDQRNTNNCSAKVSVWRPHVTIKDTDESIIITFELPGLNKDNENVVDQQQQATSYLNTMSYGKFIRSYRLPPGTDGSLIKANMDDGLLEIYIPKPKLEERYKVPIQSKL